MAYKLSLINIFLNTVKRFMLTIGYIIAVPHIDISEGNEYVAVTLTLPSHLRLVPSTISSTQLIWVRSHGNIFHIFPKHNFIEHNSTNFKKSF